jgi:hypothetical protein
MAWLLRAFGLPVWHDKTDLPPGDIGRRLNEALRSGLSGGLLVVSADADASRVIRKLEAPRLLRLAKSGKFTFAVGSLLTKPGATGLDHEAPDRLLRLGRRKLSEYKQYDLSDPGDRIQAALSLARQRMQLLSKSGVQNLGVDLQTRSAPIGRRGPFPVIIRTRPPLGSTRVPPVKAWEELGAGLHALPDLAERSGAATITVTGGGHLGAAFALGAALPVGCRWPVVILSQDSKEWVDRNLGTLLSEELECRTEELSKGADRLAVIVDLLDTVPRTDVFESHIANGRSRYACALRFSLSARRRLEASEGYPLARAVMANIREQASRIPTSKVSLFLLTPFPMAVILGRLANTLELELHEWDDSSVDPQYQPVVTVRCGCADSPITQVLCK